MTFEEWHDKQLGDKFCAIEELQHKAWDAGAHAALVNAAERFEGVVPFNWVCADGYSNGFSVGGELRYMAYKGSQGLAGLLNADEFWEKQPYGTRLYYGDGIADYLDRDVLRAAMKLLTNA